jgi:hypothetical protein
MAGYHIYSLDPVVFEQLTTQPTLEQCHALGDPIVDDLAEMYDEYEDEADPAKWPDDGDKLAKAIRKRLMMPDWYADLSMGDGVIWDTILHGLMNEPGEEIGIDLKCENDGYLYWDAAIIAAKQGATMMAEPKFGGSGFRYSGKSKGDIDLIYSWYTPEKVQTLLEQLEKVAPHFQTLPDKTDGERQQFFQGLLEPVRKIAAAKRVMWVQTDT